MSFPNIAGILNQQITLATVFQHYASERLIKSIIGFMHRYNQTYTLDRKEIGPILYLKFNEFITTNFTTFVIRWESKLDSHWTA